MENNTCVQRHWTFSLAVYNADAVAASCLNLQDDIGVDVNILLLSLLAGAIRKSPVEFHDIARTDDYMEAWRNEVVVPLRSIRRRLKSGVAPVPIVDSESLRTAIKATELEAEYIQQKVLARWLDAMPATDSKIISRADLLETGRQVVRFYLGKEKGQRELSQARLYDLADVVAAAAASELKIG